jgi:hypothetical protein
VGREFPRPPMCKMSPTRALTFVLAWFPLDTDGGTKTQPRKLPSEGAKGRKTDGGSPLSNCAVGKRGTCGSPH